MGATPASHIRLERKMIEKIKSLKNGTEINLYNPHSRNIYNLDSINLIIGNNGKGKTTLIKSIIKDLTSNGSPIEFIADGITDRLGIIYYTATPFHKPMKSSIRDKVAFLDASVPQQEKQNFVDSSLEYLAISKLLGLDRNLRSVQNFDITDLCFELASLIAPSSINRGPYDRTLSEDLNDAYSRYRSANALYNRTNRRITTFDDYVSNNNQRDPYSHQDYSDEIKELNLRLERFAKDVIDTKEEIARIFLDDCGELTEEKLTNWITTEILLKSRFAMQEKRELALRMYRNELDNLDEGSPLERRWHSYRRKVEDFIKILYDTRSGSLKFKKNQIELVVNTPKLIKASVDPHIIETAHKLGLVRIGFDNMSSGQAAIMHQMISISHSIQELKTAGKRDILIFIDEGDLLLHLNWQREYISLIDQRLNNFKKGRNRLDSLQVVIASHSPLLASDILRDSITRLDEGTKLPSFGAPIQQIVNYSFGTPSIGLVAQNIIKSLKEKEEFTEEDIEIINQIDDDFIREYMLKKAFR